jgi:NitT/TauT family transport system substrate-binding protein
MRSIQGLTRTAALAAALSLLPTLASAQQTVRIAQGFASLSFLPVWAARAQNSFAAEGLTATTVVSPGGDPAALAALDSGDVDLAAVGTESALRAAAKGQPFKIVYSLMSKVTLEVVVSPSLLERAGVKPTDPLQKRIGALKGATIGVGAVGGTQETAARWLAAKGGLDPKVDIKIAQVGSPSALQAALENKRIDAFVLSPPEGYLAAKSGAGTVLIKLGDEFPLLSNQP